MRSARCGVRGARCGVRAPSPERRAPSDEPRAPQAKAHDRWVINKIRALGGYFTKGIEGGAELRHALNSTPSLEALRDLIASTFHTAASIK